MLFGSRGKGKEKENENAKEWTYYDYMQLKFTRNMVFESQHCCYRNLYM